MTEVTHLLDRLFQLLLPLGPLLGLNLDRSLDSILLLSKLGFLSRKQGRGTLKTDENGKER